ncbi:hypothetical protein HPP92_010553 [Vanilla planifolia]|uniref:Uncharacterized protein n=1 Tax=Vanilla planifolia TaxID=51239 RepID=A0A835V0Y7_VANPL|nr:hypothetical protein HPP92_010553 [Vanilla planifolia]
MDGANSDNESRPPPHFRTILLLEVLSKKKRKKKRWEFNPELPIPTSRRPLPGGPLGSLAICCFQPWWIAW